jgi:Fe-S cluster assembly scaffold IscU
MNVHRVPLQVGNKINSQIKRSLGYSKKLVDRFENPQNIGSIKKGPNVGTGLVGAPACGDVMRLQIKVDDNGVVTESKFKTFGCGSAIAASDVASQWVQRKHIDSLRKITNQEIANYLKLPPVKLHCSMLAEDAIKAAVNDYRKNN